MSKATDEARRFEMVLRQIERRGTGSPRLLEAMRRLPRHLFLRPADRGQAYEDRPVPIGYGQTLSQPFISAYMTHCLALRGDERVLELGTGSGYQTALLAMLSAEVLSVEIEPELARRARRVLRRLGFTNVKIRVGDGLRGWAGRAPFDRILLTAAVEEVPDALLDELAPGGLLIAPVGGERSQRLVRVARHGEGFRREELLPVVFVPVHRVPASQAREAR